MSQVHQPPEEPDTRLEGLDTRLSYRVGWPALPALPVQTFPLAIDFSSHLNEIEQILEKNDVHIVAFEFGKRENVGAEVQSGQSTITIRANFEPSSAQSWIEAVISIRTYLSGVGVDHAIEIIDNHAYHGLRSFPLNPSEISLAESWSNVILPTIEGLIDHHQWIAIDLLNREYPSLSEPQPTIVISARDANDPTWHDHTVPSLNQYLHSIHCAQLYIEILYLEDVLAATKPDVEALGMTYFDAVYPGASCGKAGSKSSGTLGGKLILEKQGNRFEVGLTNHHVIFGDEIIQWSDEGRVQANCPSDSDHEFAVVENLGHIASDEAQINLLAKRGLNHVAQTQHLDSLKQRKQAIENFNRSLGSVHTSSNRRTCEHPDYREPISKNWGLDWCLIKAERFIGTLVFGLPEDSRIQKQDEMREYCDIRADKIYDVIKSGRTSGCTKGHICAESSLRLRSTPPTPREGSSIVEADMRDWQKVRCHSMIARPEGKEGKEFIRPGDSGSLVLLDEAPGAKIVGLAFGANSANLASYMTPLSLVIRDIERVTGAKVVQPKYGGVV